MKLALFFTRGVSLEQWLVSGLFEREKLIYERHLADGTLSQVYWFTYGNHDAAFAARLYTEGRLDPRIKVFPMPKLFALPKVGSWLYSFLLPWVHSGAINAVDILKTNQLDGGWAAAIAKSRVSKPLLVRCGYVQSKLEKGLHRLPKWRLALMMWGERKSFQAADIAVVTSHHNELYVMNVFGLPSNHLRVIPNALDVEAFAPRLGELTKRMVHRVLFVGRLSPEKNLINLVRAAHYAGLGLDLVGTGSQANELQQLALEIGADMRLLGAVPNDQLPVLLSQYKFFVLPSLFEGMPKTLIEAMACGLVCVGTDVDGINEVIEDGVNGFLAKSTDAESIWLALSRAINEGNDKISQSARQTVLQHYTLEACAKSEQDILYSLRQETAQHDHIEETGNGK